MTDDERLPDPRAAISCLPRGSLVILRSRDRAARAKLAEMLPRLARARGAIWTVADDAPLAAESGADGVHFPQRSIGLAAHWRARRPHWLITCTAHSLWDCACAGTAHANAILLAPVFETESHPKGALLGHLRARSIAALALLPVYALGGIDEHSARRLGGSDFAGLAAIGAWSMKT
jgi:thiamine-phosphate pyrophosphorylase